MKHRMYHDDMIRNFGSQGLLSYLGAIRSETDSSSGCRQLSWMQFANGSCPVCILLRTLFVANIKTVILPPPHSQPDICFSWKTGVTGHFGPDCPWGDNWLEKHRSCPSTAQMNTSPPGVTLMPSTCLDPAAMWVCHLQLTVFAFFG